MFLYCVIEMSMEAYMHTNFNSKMNLQNWVAVILSVKMKFRYRVAKPKSFIVWGSAENDSAATSRNLGRYGHFVERVRYFAST